MGDGSKAMEPPWGRLSIMLSASLMGVTHAYTCTVCVLYIYICIPMHSKNSGIQWWLNGDCPGRIQKNGLYSPASSSSPFPDCWSHRDTDGERESPTPCCCVVARTKHRSLAQKNINSHWVFGVSKQLWWKVCNFHTVVGVTSPRCFGYGGWLRNPAPVGTWFIPLYSHQLIIPFIPLYPIIIPLIFQSHYNPINYGIITNV